MASNTTRDMSILIQSPCPGSPEGWGGEPGQLNRHSGPVATSLTEHNSQAEDRGVQTSREGMGDRDPGKEKASRWPPWGSSMEKKMKENTLSVTFNENYVCFLPKTRQEKIQNTCFLKIESSEIEGGLCYYWPILKGLRSLVYYLLL